MKVHAWPARIPSGSVGVGAAEGFNKRGLGYLRPRVSNFSRANALRTLSRVAAGRVNRGSRGAGRRFWVGPCGRFKKLAPSPVLFS